MGLNHDFVYQTIYLSIQEKKSMPYIINASKFLPEIQKIVLIIIFSFKSINEKLYN